MKRKMQELQKRLALSQPQAFKQDNSISKKIGSSVDNKLVKKDTHSTNSTSLQGNSGPMKKKSCNSSLLNGNGKTYTKSPNFTKQKPSEERKIHESPKGNFIHQGLVGCIIVNFHQFVCLLIHTKLQKALRAVTIFNKMDLDSV